MAEYQSLICKLTLHHREQAHSYRKLRRIHDLNEPRPNPEADLPESQ